MSTWMGLYQSAQADIGVFYPNLRITARQALRWGSEAQHEYQVQTKAVKCSTQFDLIPEGTTGVYPLPKCPEVIYLAEYLASDNALAQFPQIVDWETFQRMKSNWIYGEWATQYVPAPNMYSAPYPITPFPMMVTFIENEIHIYPYQGISGTIRLSYQPALMPFDASNPTGGDWATFGTNPEARMKVTSYEPQFRAAELGIKAYIKAMMMTSIPNYRQLFPGYYEEQMGIFMAGVQKIIKRNPPQDKNVRSLAQMGPVM